MSQSRVDLATGQRQRRGLAMPVLDVVGSGGTALRSRYLQHPLRMIHRDHIDPTARQVPRQHASPGADVGDQQLFRNQLGDRARALDIVIDAFRVEILAEREQGAGAAAVQLGYRLGMLVSGAGALTIAQTQGWTAAYLAMGLGMGIGLVATLLAREPRRDVAASGPGGPGGGGGRASLADWAKDHVVEPFGDFLTRPGWAGILVFIVLYKLGDAVAGFMTNPFYIQIGFSLIEIGVITKVFGLAATLTGAVIGGVIVARAGILRALLWCGLAQMGSNLMFALQALVGADPYFLMATIGVENLSGGMATVAFVAYISRLCSIRFTATQYALFSSLAALGRTVIVSAGGWLAGQLGWFWFFVASTACALPGLLVLLWMMRGHAGFVEEEDSHADRIAQGNQGP